MKTSNKLLLAIGIVVVVAAALHAVAIKDKFEKIKGTHDELAVFSADTFTQVEITGTAPSNLQMEISLKYDERTRVAHTDHDFLHITQEGSKLKIHVDHPKGYESDVRRAPKITILCPRLERISMVGTPLDSLDLPENAHALTRAYYSKSTVNIDGYAMDNLTLFASNGAEIILGPLNRVDSLRARIGGSGRLAIRGGNLGYVSLEVDKQGKIELNSPQIGTLRTRVDLEGELMMKGTDLTFNHVIDEK